VPTSKGEEREWEKGRKGMGWGKGGREREGGEGRKGRGGASNLASLALPPPFTKS